MIEVNGVKMDLAYVRRQIAAAIGEDDPRTRTWDRLVREFGPGA